MWIWIYLNFCKDSTTRPFQKQFLHVNLDLSYFLQGFDHAKEEPRPSCLRMGWCFVNSVNSVKWLILWIMFQHKIIEEPLVLQTILNNTIPKLGPRGAVTIEKLLVLRRVHDARIPFFEPLLSSLNGTNNPWIIVSLSYVSEQCQTFTFTFLKVTLSHKRTVNQRTPSQFCLSSYYRRAGISRWTTCSIWRIHRDQKAFRRYVEVERFRDKSGFWW